MFLKHDVLLIIVLKYETYQPVKDNLHTEDVQIWKFWADAAPMFLRSGKNGKNFIFNTLTISLFTSQMPTECCHKKS